MKACKCGGKMYRHGHCTLKSGEEKMRFRCMACGAQESYYRNGARKDWQFRAPVVGRPKNDDMVFRRPA